MCAQLTFFLLCVYPIFWLLTFFIWPRINLEETIILFFYGNIFYYYITLFLDTVIFTRLVFLGETVIDFRSPLFLISPPHSKKNPARLDHHGMVNRKKICNNSKFFRIKPWTKIIMLHKSHFLLVLRMITTSIDYGHHQLQRMQKRSDLRRSKVIAINCLERQKEEGGSTSQLYRFPDLFFSITFSLLSSSIIIKYREICGPSPRQAHQLIKVFFPLLSLYFL